MYTVSCQLLKPMVWNLKSAGRTENIAILMSDLLDLKQDMRRWGEIQC